MELNNAKLEGGVAVFLLRVGNSNVYKFDFFLDKNIHVPNITALHHAKFGEYGSLSTMVTVGGAESTPHPPWERGHFKGRGDKSYVDTSN